VVNPLLSGHLRYRTAAIAMLTLAIISRLFVNWRTRVVDLVVGCRVRW
jgi:hypothetical protein